MAAAGTMLLAAMAAAGTLLVCWLAMAVLADVPTVLMLLAVVVTCGVDDDNAEIRIFQCRKASSVRSSSLGSILASMAVVAVLEAAPVVVEAAGRGV